MKRIALTSVAVLCAALLGGAATSAGTQSGVADREAVYKATHDTDPHLALTPGQQRVLELKDQTIAAHEAGDMEREQALREEIRALHLAALAAD